MRLYGPWGKQQDWGPAILFHLEHWGKGERTRQNIKAHQMPFESPLRLCSYKRFTKLVEEGDGWGRNWATQRQETGVAILVYLKGPHHRTVWGRGEHWQKAGCRMRSTAKGSSLFCLREYDSILHSHIKRSAFSHILERDHGTVSHPHTLHLNSIKLLQSLFSLTIFCKQIVMLEGREATPDKSLEEIVGIGAFTLNSYKNQ